MIFQNSFSQVKGFVVAIDGPAGSGKSTTARLVAERLGFFHLDTGAMYRAVTLKVIENKVNFRNQRALGSLLQKTTVDLKWEDGKMRVLLDGQDVTERIRSPEVNEMVSPISAIGIVRKRMVAEQRRLVQGRAVVCEGRDIGSVVFPDADLKIYLDCDLAERARRRQAELKGSHLSFNAVKSNLAQRDRIDAGRTIGPLRRVPDAVLIDTTHLTIEEQVALVCVLVRRKIAFER